MRPSKVARSPSRVPHLRPLKRVAIKCWQVHGVHNKPRVRGKQVVGSPVGPNPPCDRGTQTASRPAQRSELRGGLPEFACAAGPAITPEGGSWRGGLGIAPHPQLAPPSDRSTQPRCRWPRETSDLARAGAHQCRPGTTYRGHPAALPAAGRHPCVPNATEASPEAEITHPAKQWVAEPAGPSRGPVRSGPAKVAASRHPSGGRPRQRAWSAVPHDLPSHAPIRVHGRATRSSEGVSSGTMVCHRAPKDHDGLPTRAGAEAPQPHYHGCARPFPALSLHATPTGRS